LLATRAPAGAGTDAGSRSLHEGHLLPIGTPQQQPQQRQQQQQQQQQLWKQITRAKSRNSGRCLMLPTGSSADGACRPPELQQGQLLMMAAGPPIKGTCWTSEPHSSNTSNSGNKDKLPAMSGGGNGHWE